MLKAGDEIFLGNRSEMPMNLWDERSFRVVEIIKKISEPLESHATLAQMLNKMQPIVIDNNENEDEDDDKNDDDDDNYNNSNIKNMCIDANRTENVAFHQESSVLHTPENSPIYVSSSSESTSPEKQTASRDQCNASRRLVFSFIWTIASNAAGSRENMKRI